MSEDLSKFFDSCKNGNIEEVKTFLDKGVNVNSTNSEMKTPLIIASSRGHINIVSLLLQRNANIHAKNIRQYNSLHFACFYGYSEVVNLLLDNNADIEDKDSSGVTPLMMASVCGHVNIVSLLLQRNANIHCKKKHGQDNSLHFACMYGHLEVVNILLDNNANIEAKTSIGNTPLMIASEKGYLDVVSLLLKRNANIHAEDFLKKNSLYIACTYGHLEIVNFLIDNNANIKNNTLMIAYMKGHISILKILIQKSKKILEYRYLKYLLQLSMYDDNLECVLYLINPIGINPSKFIDKYGFSLRNNDPQLRPPLTDEVKASRVAQVISAWEAYLLQKKRDENWNRRWSYMKIFVGHRFIQLATTRTALQAVALPTNVKIPDLPNKTRLQKYILKRDKVFSNNRIIAKIFSFL